EVKAVKRAPALTIRLDPQLGADGGRDEQGRSAGIHDEVVRSLAVDLGADQHMLRVGDLVRDLIRFGLGLLRLICPKRRVTENQRETGATPLDSHATTPGKGRTISVQEGCDSRILIIQPSLLFRARRTLSERETINEGQIT